MVEVEFGVFRLGVVLVDGWLLGEFGKGKLIVTGYG